MKTTVFRALWLLLLALITTCAAKKDQPDVSESPFESPLYNLFYFEDSDVVIAVDFAPQIVYRSTDGGANWKKVPEVKGASLHIRPHPYNNQIAVAMSHGREHWITKDQGGTWTGFETDFQPMSGQEPVVFHATDPDKMIFLTQGCADGDCTGQVRDTDILSSRRN